ncbi:MAG: oligosaccharide flippase family protein [Anaerolineales bacterium]|nr:oligosaccharide flippase family protein [Anaerolineales bacterium]
MTSPPPRSSLARILLRGTVWTTLGSYAGQLLGFAAVLVLTRLLDQTTFGWLALATFWVSLLNLRTKAGLNYSAIRQPVTTGELLGSYYALDLALGALSFTLSCVAAVLLPRLGYPRPVALAVVALMGAESLVTLVSPLAIALEKELQVSRLTLVTLVGYVAAYAVAIPLALAGGGLWSLLAINLVAAVVSLGGVYVTCRQRWPEAFRLRWRFDRDLARRLIREGLPTGLSYTALASIVNQFDNFLIGTFVSAATLGLYDRAYRIASWPNLLATTIITRIGFLAFAKVREDPERLAQAVQLALWGLAVISLPLALGLLFGANDIIQVLYGDRWAESAPFLRFLSLYSLIWPVTSLGYWLAAAVGHHRTALGLTAAQAATIIGLGVPLTLWLGVTGTLLAVAATMLVACGLTNFYVFRQISLSPFAVYGRPGLAAAAALLALWLAQRALAWSAWPAAVRLGVMGIIIVAVFGGLLFVLEGAALRERLRYLVRLW